MHFPRVLGLVALLAAGFSLTSCESSKESWVSSFPETLVTTPRPGKNIKTAHSPDLVYALIVRDEGEHGDFVWYTVYLQKGRRHSLIGTFNSVDQIAWNQESTRVSFHGQKAVESNVMQDANYQYYPYDEVLRSRVIKKTVMPN